MWLGLLISHKSEPFFDQQFIYEALSMDANDDIMGEVLLVRRFSLENYEGTASCRMWHMLALPWTTVFIAHYYKFDLLCIFFRFGIGQHIEPHLVYRQHFQFPPSWSITYDEFDKLVFKFFGHFLGDESPLPNCEVLFLYGASYPWNCPLWIVLSRARRYQWSQQPLYIYSSSVVPCSTVKAAGFLRQ